MLIVLAGLLGQISVRQIFLKGSQPNPRLAESQGIVLCLLLFIW